MRWAGRYFFIFFSVTLIFTCLLAQNHPGNATQTGSAVWIPDLGNGVFKNPVIFADYSDPDVCRVGEDYYLVSSSFDAIPGLPILHSEDLVNWTIIGHALQAQPPCQHYSKT